MPREKFTQIYAALKSRIESGVYPVGQLLPSENTLIGEFSCSRNTVRRAISELVRDGYVQTSQGKGVCNIFQPIERSSYTMGTIESFRETAQRTGQHTATRVVELERWQEDKFYDRFGLDEQTVDILGIKLPIVTIPVQPGRNLAVIVEVAAMNNRAKKYGFNAAAKLAEELERHVQNG